MSYASNILHGFIRFDANQRQPEAAATLVHACEVCEGVATAENHGWVRYTFRDHSEILVSIGADGLPDGWKP